MIAHFVNNACLIVLAQRRLDDADGDHEREAAAALVALGLVGLAAGAALLARDHRTRRVAARPR